MYFHMWTEAWYEGSWHPLDGPRRTLFNRLSEIDPSNLSDDYEVSLLTPVVKSPNNVRVTITVSWTFERHRTVKHRTVGTGPDRPYFQAVLYWKFLYGSRGRVMGLAGLRQLPPSDRNRTVPPTAEPVSQFPFFSVFFRWLSHHRSRAPVTDGDEVCALRGAAGAASGERRDSTARPATASFSLLATRFSHLPRGGCRLPRSGEWREMSDSGSWPLTI